MQSNKVKSLIGCKERHILGAVMQPIPMSFRLSRNFLSPSQSVTRVVILSMEIKLARATDSNLVESVSTMISRVLSTICSIKLKLLKS